MGEFPSLKELYKEFHTRGLEIIGISIDEDRAAAEQAIKKVDAQWPQICDGKADKGPLIQSFNAGSIPLSYLIGPDGRIAGKSLGHEELRRKLNELLSASPERR